MTTGMQLGPSGRSGGRTAAIVAILATAAAASLAASGSARGAAQPGGSRPALAATMGSDLPSGVTVVRDQRSGVVRFVGAPAGHPLARPSTVAAGASPTAVAAAFLRGHAAMFGLEAPATELTAGRHVPAPGGRSVVRFTQRLHGFPVLGGQLTVTLTPDSRIAYVTGETVQQRQPLATPRMTTRQAERISTTVTSSAEGVPAGRLTAHAPSLAVFDPELLGVPSTGRTALVYRVDVTGDAPTGVPIDELVLVDAATGGVALHVNQAEAAVQQVVCNARDDNAHVFYFDCPPTEKRYVPTVVADPETSTDQEVQQAYGNAAATIAFYRDIAGDASGIGIADGTDRSVNSTVRICYAPQGAEGSCELFPNAYWSGHEMRYGDGFAAAEDVVAHELTHSVVRNTANLLPLYQSGAIDESMADVMGELVDQWDPSGTDGEAYRWMIGEDLPAVAGVLRDMADPTIAPAGVPTPRFVPQPDAMTSPLYRAPGVPVSPGGRSTQVPDDNGGVHINSGVGDKAAYLIVDGGRFNGITVPGLGGADPVTRPAALVKAAKIYLLALESLTSGSDYADLARALSASCAALVGVAGIGPADCDTVAAAVRATAMETSPPAAPAPDAPVCDGGGVPSTDWYDDMETPADNRWILDPGVSWLYQDGSPGSGYATSGVTSLHALDVDAAGLSHPGHWWPLDGTATMAKPIRVPVGKPAYLRFNHAYDFEWYPATYDSEGIVHPAVYRDGGRIGYSTDGRRWHSAESLIDVGGYNHTIRGRSGARPWQVFRGFGGSSHGYVSSRLDLSSLAGQRVWFRFRSTIDFWVGANGWFIDDVRFYTCGAQPAAPTGVVATPGVNRETVTWRAPSDHGTSALHHYEVTVRSGGEPLVTRGVRPGIHSVTVTGLPGGEPLTAWVKAVNGSGSSWAASSNRLLGTTLTISASTLHLAGGHSVTLSGRLLKAGTTSGLAGRRVGLYRAAPGSSHWSWLASTTTNDRGGYAFHRSPTSDSAFQVRYLGARPYQGAASASRGVRVG